MDKCTNCGKERKSEGERIKPWVHTEEGSFCCECSVKLSK